MNPTPWSIFTDRSNNPPELKDNNKRHDKEEGNKKQDPTKQQDVEIQPSPATNVDRTDI